MTNPIVVVNVSQQVAPAPSNLQQTGAFLSQGATNTAQGTLSLLTQLSDLTSILTPAAALTTLAWSGGTVTATTTSPHGITTGQSLKATIAGCTPSGYNGTYTVTATGANTFTYPLVSNPGTIVTPGTWIPDGVAELTAMATTFFAQGSDTSVYVLELGLGSTTAAVAYLTTWLTNNPNRLYAVLVPRTWDSESTFPTLIASYESTTSKFYFYVTTTTGTYTTYTALMKDVVALVEAPSTPATEFSLAFPFHRLLKQQPSATNKVPPFAFAYGAGVTPYPTANNGPLLASLKTASVNYIGTGAEGGISNSILLWGVTKDGRDISYWYSVDWAQVNVQIDLANEIINGSNNPLAPLYYDQDGINRLQARAQLTFNRGITYGLVLPPAPVTAVPFATYVAQNPSDYPVGTYNGLACEYTPQRGFTHIVFNIVVTDFPLA